jgi:hypothetical protein
MFDGTDLSLAYGGASYEPLPSQQALPQQMQMPAAQPPPPPPMELPQSTMSHSQAPDVSYAPPLAMYAQQPTQQYVPVAPPQDSLWDRISQKKVDVLKLFLLALVVLLGVSMDRVVTHYLTTYIGKAFLSDLQELVVRMSYPIIILVVIWLIKALA